MVDTGKALATLALMACAGGLCLLALSLFLSWVSGLRVDTATCATLLAVFAAPALSLADYRERAKIARDLKAK